MPEGIMFWLLQRRYDDISINFRNLWDMYLKFYTVFLTFNVVAIGWFSNGGVTGDARWIVATAFILQCVFTAVTSAKLALYSNRVHKQLANLADEFASLATARKEPFKHSSCTQTSLPLDIGLYGGWVNCVAMVFVGLVWLALACSAA